jgi:hypothetical protein
MADFLDEKRKEIDARLKELRPLVDEFNRLEKAAAALAGVGGSSSAAASAPAAAPATRRRTRGGGGASTGGGRSRKSSKGSGGARRGRPRGSGTRGKQALELVRAKPGISIAELADQMGIKANYLYRVMPSLEAEGQVAKRDGGWHPAK